MGKQIKGQKGYMLKPNAQGKMQWQKDGSELDEVKKGGIQSSPLPSYGRSREEFYDMIGDMDSQDLRYVIADNDHDFSDEEKQIVADQYKKLSKIETMENLCDKLDVSLNKDGQLVNDDGDRAYVVSSNERGWSTTNQNLHDDDGIVALALLNNDESKDEDNPHGHYAEMLQNIVKMKENYDVNFGSDPEEDIQKKIYPFDGDTVKLMNRAFTGKEDKFIRHDRLEDCYVDWGDNEGHFFVDRYHHGGEFLSEYNPNEEGDYIEYDF